MLRIARKSSKYVLAVEHAEFASFKGEKKLFTFFLKLFFHSPKNSARIPGGTRRRFDVEFRLKWG